MTQLSHRVWYVKDASTKIVQLHPTLDLQQNDGLEWFEKLVKDIDEHGLDNPVVVHNQTMPCDENTPCRVVHGCNRYRAIRRLGWPTVPALIVGSLQFTPFAKTAVELHSVEEAQSYLTDGVFTNDRFGCKVLDANWAQTGIYLRTNTPYKPGPRSE